MIKLYVLKKLNSDTDSDYPCGTYTWLTESACEKFRTGLPYKIAIQYEVICLSETSIVSGSK
jgi:hypothetical protein